MQPINIIFYNSLKEEGNVWKYFQQISKSSTQSFQKPFIIQYKCWKSVSEIENKNVGKINKQKIVKIFLNEIREFVLGC